MTFVSELISLQSPQDSDTITDKEEQLYFQIALKDGSTVIATDVKDKKSVALSYVNDPKKRIKNVVYGFKNMRDDCNNKLNKRDRTARMLIDEYQKSLKNKHDGNGKKENTTNFKFEDIFPDAIDLDPFGLNDDDFPH